MTCVWCKLDFSEPGAVLIGPPWLGDAIAQEDGETAIVHMTVEKSHLCPSCHRGLEETFEHIDPPLPGWPTPSEPIDAAFNDFRNAMMGESG